MSDIHNKGNIKNQINNPEKVVIHEGREIPHQLTKIPKPEDKVIGRDKDIQRLKEALESAQQVVLMNGLGGIGKTTTATAYVQQYKGDYTHIAWLEDVDDFSTDTASNAVLTKNLGITPTKNTVADTQRLLNTLSNLGGPSLLVIDNAHQSLQHFKSYLPQAPNWQVLITSREELPFATTFRLGFLSEEKARELFYSHYDRDQDDAQVNTICAAIDYHTLTIELLAKTAHKLRITPLSKLGSLLEEKGIRLNRKINLANVSHSQGEQVEKLFPYLKAIFQLDDSISDEEIHLLKQFVALPPNFIPFDQLRSLLQIEEDSEAYDTFISTLDLLKTKGWLNHDAAQDGYKMHRIVQKVMEAHLQLAFEDVEVLVKSVSEALQIDDSKDNPVEKFPMTPFGERVMSLFNSVDRETLADLLDSLGHVYKYKGQYERSKELREQSLQWYQSAGEEYQQDVARLQSNLAMVLKNLGYFKQAAQLLKSALEFDIEHYGEDHSEVAIKRSNLATVLQELGDFQGAKQLLQLALTSAEENFGKEHPTTAIRYSNLALVLQDLGDFQGAKQLLQLALNSDEKNFGKEHPNTAISYSNLALVLQDLGDFQGAKQLLQLAVTSDEKNFGKEHPDTAISYSNLALVLQDLGDFQGAKQLLQLAVTSDEKNFGKEHPNTAIRYSNLASLYQKLKQFQSAAEYMEDSLRIGLKTLGADHPTLAMRYRKLDSILQDGIEAGDQYCIQLRKKLDKVGDQ